MRDPGNEVGSVSSTLIWTEEKKSHLAFWVLSRHKISFRMERIFKVNKRRKWRIL